MTVNYGLLSAAGVLVTAVVGAVVAFVRLRPEGDQIIVLAAKDVVKIQKDALGDLRAQIEGLEARLNREVAAAQAELVECRREREREAARNRELSARVTVLEAELAQLKDGG